MKTSTMLKSAVAAGAFAVAGVATANADTITVQAGDTLSKLARANGTTVDALAKANGISNPNLIFVGQQLQTEGTANAAAPAQPAATQPAASANGTYTVKAGDTLNRIAAANGTSVAALAAANGIQNINLIAVGQVLKLSADATAPAATPAPVQQAAPAQPAASGSVPDDVKYIAAADTNRDGFMTAAEYLAYQANGGTTAPAAPQVTQVSTAGNSAAATMLNSLNALRASLGLRPVTLDAGLSAQAQSRAYNAVANGGLPTNHFRTNGEVVAIGFGFNQVISAWYNETGMMTNGTPGHRMWVTNPRATSVGFGVVGGTIVAVSNVGQY
ncbi:LysM peptidoglycan-binding domain-containing protein [Leuconostoc lactis]|uniref:LysM peptidoglycan-binding domain-containing protein n=1 Tax=Leuconostoc lactis TaxID=1246 RepID=UPI0011BAF21E|nr:LysM peptidoglycan-binding domain-containing protein [Leuconostoc lactis]QEA50986.1 LysM peptidoglycan-binding domain-containing protein [Leuconostoc lactis]